MDLFDIAIAKKLAGEGGGGDIDVDALTVTENGTYSASSGHAYDPVTVSVPTGVFPSGTSSITSNGIYDITNFASVDVNVSGGGGRSDDEWIKGGADFKGSVSGSTTYIREAIFKACSITEANFPNASKIDTSAFAACFSLSKAYFPEASEVGSSAFYNCEKLEDLYLPSVKTIGAQAFSGCSMLSSIDFPLLKSVASSTFAKCRNLATVKLSVASVINTNGFGSCSKLMELYLYSNSRVTLGTSGTFLNTPMFDSTLTGAFGSIYVPASLVSVYKTATNWSYYSDRITSYVE